MRSLANVSAFWSSLISLGSTPSLLSKRAQYLGPISWLIHGVMGKANRFISDTVAETAHLWSHLPNRALHHSHSAGRFFKKGQPRPITVV